MISLAAETKVFLTCRPVDLRNGFDGLAAKAQRMIGENSFGGHLLSSAAHAATISKAYIGTEQACG